LVRPAVRFLVAQSLPGTRGQGATLALRDGELGLIVKCWAGCKLRDVFAELRRRGLLDANAGDATEPPDPAAAQLRREAEAADRERRINLARDMWQSALPATGTVVERYLRSRGIEIPVPPSMRFIGMHTSYGRHGPSGDKRPVMVAAVEHVENGLVGSAEPFCRSTAVARQRWVRRGYLPARSLVERCGSRQLLKP
jgi:hypothetical protein